MFPGRPKRLKDISGMCSHSLSWTCFLLSQTCEPLRSLARLRVTLSTTPWVI